MEESEPGNIAVLHGFPIDPEDPVGGHAERWETGLMMALYPDTVDLRALPSLPSPLGYQEFGILDLPVSLGDPTPDYTVRSEQDPRHAYVEEGRENLAKEAKRLSQLARDALDFLK